MAIVITVLQNEEKWHQKKYKNPSPSHTNYVQCEG